LKFLITGNLGYIGPVLTKLIKLSYPNSYIIGFDNNYFSNCAISPNLKREKPYVDLQVYGDVRDNNKIDKYVKEVNHVIHLAAISNDPMGKEFESVTKEINQEASIYLAKRCIENNIDSFVFASSCSVYGAGGDAPKNEFDEVNPLTAYAKSKIGTENTLKSLNSYNNTKITCLRFATACGYSPNLRLDLVLNDFVATALTKNKIEVLSDGSPWRPLIDVKDMSKALLWSCLREVGNQFEILNAGSNSCNYQVSQLAEIVATQIGQNVEVSINKNAQPDKRSYQVSFDKYDSLVGNNFKPNISMLESASMMIENIKKQVNFLDANNRTHLIRLHVLKTLKFSGELSTSLEWI